MKNKRKIINKKLATGVLITSLSLTALGCAKKNEKRPIETVVVYETVIVTATPEPTKVPTNTPVPTNTTTSTPIPTPTEVPNQEDDNTPPTEYHSADGGIDAFWDDVYNTINYINWKIDNIDYDEVKESTINHAKQLIDFIFYGGEMNGITFDELKDDAKQKVYEELQKVDSFIMEFIPDYKERLGEKYNLVKNFASTTLEKAKEVFNSHIDIDVTINKGNFKKKALVLNNKKSK